VTETTSDMPDATRNGAAIAATDPSETVEDGSRVCSAQAPGARGLGTDALPGIAS